MLPAAATPWLFLWAAATIREEGAPLRAVCAPDEPPVAKLAAGTPVVIRFSLTAAMPCYKVTVGTGAGAQTGYVPMAAVDNRAGEQARAAAGGLGITAAPPPMPPALKATSDALEKPWALIQANQPREALALLEAHLRKAPKDAMALAMAGYASLRADQARVAVDYLEQSLAIQANPDIERLRERALREAKNDRSQDQLHGLRVTLRYEGMNVPADVARAMTAALDDEFARIAQALGCRSDEKIAAVVQTPDAYRATTAAVEWSGGHYDGRIHVPLLEGARIGPVTRRTFAHELVHACLAHLGAYPAWLHEGLAQKLSGEVLDDGRRAMVESAIRAKAVPPLEQIGQSWAGLNAAQARLAYALALAAVEKLDQQHASVGWRTLLTQPSLLAAATTGVNRQLGLIQ
jgi:hypothetical protein